MIGLRALVLSYRDYELDQLAKAYLNEEEVRELLNNLNSAVILQTCNRVEFYLDHDEDFNQVSKLITERSGLRPRVYEELDAVRHLLMVTAGLDSMFFGEREILTQVKRALSAGKPSPMLRKLFEMAIRFGERFRREHNLGELSFTSFLNDFIAGRVSEGDSVLVVGGGEVARAVVRGLIRRGVRGVTVVNRSLDRLIHEFGNKGVRVLGLDKLHEELSLNHYDVLVSAVSVKSPIIDITKIPSDHVPRLIIDVSTPRSVDVNGKFRDRIVTLEDLRGEYVKYINGKFQALNYSGEVEGEARRIYRLLLRGLADDVVRDVMGFVERIREEEVREAVNALRSGRSPEEVIEAMSRSLVKKLMHNYLESIRRGVEVGRMDIVNELKNSLLGRS
ncbi:glutamyl-tRNA reductase [Vulcanisaeta thermophila]|uniref:glutamyl-tRNA reductase n=1 Tax=Vulcanisaeta thermophila TaxID=867917 RepID=UPI000852E80E|nr:glutamyl-tRNA reductase [Vulcanisaeta thermophila]